MQRVADSLRKGAGGKGDGDAPEASDDKGKS